MKPSPLQVEEYFLKELTFKVNDNYDDKKPGDQSKDFKCTLEVAQNNKDPFRWRCIFGLSCIAKEDENIPYSFSILLEGYFVIDQHITEEEKRERLVNANAPALLYTVAREILSSASGSAPLGRINIPTVYFSPLTSVELQKELNGKTQPDKAEAKTTH